MWEFDPTLLTWSQKANFPGHVRSGLIGFVIGNVAYAGTGYYLGTNYRDFYKYNQQSNTWSQISNFIGTMRNSGSGFAVGGKGYVGIGYDGNSVFPVDFYEYDAVTDTWAQIASYPSEGRTYPFSWVINDRAYVGTGKNALNQYTTTVYELTTPFTGIDELTAEFSGSIEFFNSESTLQVSYELAEYPNSKLEIYSLLGQQLYSIQLEGSSGMKAIPKLNTNSSISLYSLTSGNRIVHTGKLLSR